MPACLWSERGAITKSSSKGKVFLEQEDNFFSYFILSKIFLEYDWGTDSGVLGQGGGEHTFKPQIFVFILVGGGFSGFPLGPT